MSTSPPAVIVELMGQPKGCPVRYTCDNYSQFEKGDLLWFEDPRKVSGASVADTAYAPPINETWEPVALAAEIAVARLRR